MDVVENILGKETKAMTSTCNRCGAEGRWFHYKLCDECSKEDY